MPVNVGERGEMHDDGLGPRGDSGEPRRQHEGHELVPARLVAERDRARLVLADAFEDLAEGRVHDAPDEQQAEDELDEDEVVHGERPVEVDEPQEVAARHRLQPVLAAGERRLQAGEVDDLREGEGDHREVDPLPPDGEAADGGAERRAREAAEQDAQLRRQAHLFDRVARDVGGEAEECRVAEGQQPRVSEEEVERAGVDGEAEGLHHEHRVDEEGRPQAEQEQRRHGGAPGERARHRVRPKRPAGCGRGTIAMITKITTWEASGYTTLVKPSMTPSPRPVTIVPRIEPSPPMTTTAKITTMMLDPMSGLTWYTGAARTPAKAASATPRPYVNVTSRGTLIPNVCTSTGFSTPARRYAPSRVRSIAYQMTRHTTTDTTMTQPR